MHSFHTLIDSKNLERAIEEVGYETPTPIQEKAIPIVLEGKDLIAKSNTGTGKTAAFGLPILKKIEDKEFKSAIIICPTRELVQQADLELRKFSKHLKNINIVSVYGGAPIERQIRSLKQGYQIVVGTPGRLLDHIRRKTLKLYDCDCVVLDEADEMLNMGFREDIETILEKVQADHQTILFSATMPKEIRRIADTYLKDKVEIEVKSKQKTVERITQHYYDVRRDQKANAVKRLLTYYDTKLCIIFCNTKANVDELVESLHQKKIQALGLHGDIRQEKRTKIMNRFKTSERAVLVASDVAARGIDVNNIDMVINFDIPQDNEIYVHRIGRTGRAGKEGLALTFIQSKRQFFQLKDIMKYTNAVIERKELPDEFEMGKRKRTKFIEEILEVHNKQGLIQENLQIANELIKEGMSAEDLISALINFSYGGNVVANEKPKEERKAQRPERKPAKKKNDDIELKFSLGKSKDITKMDVLNAINGKCDLREEGMIHKIDVRKMYTIVSVDKKVGNHILENMNRSKINNKRCEVYFYKKEKSASKSQD